jgi:hypothetical protein
LGLERDPLKVAANRRLAAIERTPVVTPFKRLQADVDRGATTQRV